MWPIGSHVTYREVIHGKVWTARPVTVIQDTPDLIALYLHNHTHWMVCTPPNAGIDLAECKANLREWHLKDEVWRYGDTVFLISPGRAHAVHVMWDQQRRFVGWYANLQEPLRRTGLGWDFLDQELDIVVSPDLSWQWKDRESLEQAQQLCLFPPELVRAILHEGQHVVGNIQSKLAPFDGSWNTWKPPSEWSVPCLPDGWDRVG